MKISIKDSLIGFAIGDALGVSGESEHRDDLLTKPIISMQPSYNYGVPKGTWSDDTAMTLATIDSIIKCKKIDINNIALNFCDWINDGKYTADGVVFDIGGTIKEAMMNFWDLKDAYTCGSTRESDNGNGSLMRILPAVFYLYSINADDDMIYENVKDISSITHAHDASIMACFIYTIFMIQLIKGANKKEAYKYVQKYKYNKYFSNSIVILFKKILELDISELKLNDIKSSSYVIDTLEAVFWVVLRSNSYEESIVGSVNLGGDTDTIGAITGSITALIYGYKTIPKAWLKDLVNSKYLLDVSKKFDKLLKEVL